MTPRPDADALRATIDALDREPWRGAYAHLRRHDRAMRGLLKAFAITLAILSAIAACFAAVGVARRDAERQAAVDAAEQIHNERR